MKTLWRIDKGCMVPYDESTVEFMRAAHFRRGDVVACEITMARSKVFMQAVHKMARLLANNTDMFHGKREHDVIKQLQVESRVWCDVFGIEFDGKRLMLFKAKSLSFDDMDEAEFRQGFDQMAEYVAATYWPEFDLSILDNEDF